MLESHSGRSSVANQVVGGIFREDESGCIRIGHGFSGTSRKKLNHHEHLFLEDAQHNHIFIVLKGVIGTYKMMADGRRQILGFSYPGDVLGLDCPDFYRNNAEALTDCEVRCIPVSAIDRLMESEPGFGLSILRMTSQELADAREQLVSLGQKSAVEKIATFLLRIARRNEQAGYGASTLYLPMKRADIGDHLGLTIETVSRNITKLKVAQVIRLRSKSEIDILDREALVALAEGHTH